MRLGLVPVGNRGVVVTSLVSVAVLDANRLSDHPATNRRRTLGEMLVEAAKGTISITGNGEILVRRHGENGSETVPYSWQDVDFGGDCVYRTQAAAIDALMGRAPAVNTAEHYLANLRIEEAIYESHNQGRRIAFS